MLGITEILSFGKSKVLDVPLLDVLEKLPAESRLRYVIVYISLRFVFNICWVLFLAHSIDKLMAVV